MDAGHPQGSKLPDTQIDAKAHADPVESEECRSARFDEDVLTSGQAVFRPWKAQETAGISDTSKRPSTGSPRLVGSMLQPGEEDIALGWVR